MEVLKCTSNFTVIVPSLLHYNCSLYIFQILAHLNIRQIFMLFLTTFKSTCMHFCVLTSNLQHVYQWNLHNVCFHMFIFVDPPTPPPICMCNLQLILMHICSSPLYLASFCYPICYGPGHEHFSWGKSLWQNTHNPTKTVRGA